MIRTRDDKISDYIQSAPKGTSRRAIEEMVKKYKGDETKISEGISAMWNKRESAAHDAQEQGKWEAVVKKSQKKKERQDKPGGQVANGGRPSTRGGRDSRGRQRSGNPSKGRAPRSEAKGRPETSNKNNNANQSTGATPSVVDENQPAQAQSNAPTGEVTKPQATNNENKWSRGPPDFSKAVQPKQESKRQPVKTDSGESKEDPTPGQAFSGKGKKEIEIVSPSPAGEENGSLVSPSEKLLSAEPEKPKIPSWADRARQSAAPKPPAPKVPQQAGQQILQSKKATEAPEEANTQNRAEPSVSSAPQEEKANHKEILEKSESTPETLGSLDKPEKSDKDIVPTVAKPEPVSKPVSTQERPKVPFEKAVKLPPNFGVSSFDIAFGSSHHLQAAAPTKDSTNENVWSAHKPISKVDSGSTTDITFGSSINNESSNSPALDRTQRNFMDHLIHSNETEDEGLGNRSRTNILPSASVRQQSLSDANVVTVAEFESKMIAAVDGSEVDDDDSQTSDIPVKSQEKSLASENIISSGSSQQSYQQVKTQQGQQASGVPAGVQQQAQGTAQQRGFPQQKNARSKAPRPRIGKTYSAGPRTGVQPHQLQGQDGHLLPPPLQQQGPQVIQPNPFPPMPLDHTQHYALPFQQPSDPNVPFSYPYGQQINDMYGASSYGYPSTTDPFYGQHPHSQSSQNSRTTGPPPGLGGPTHGDMRAEPNKSTVHQQTNQKDTQSQQLTPPTQQHTGLSSQQSLHNYQNTHQVSQNQGPHFGVSGAPPTQYGQSSFSAPPPGMPAVQYQGTIPSQFYPAYYNYGFPQYTGSQFGGPSPRSQMNFATTQRMYDSGLSAFPGPTTMYDQGNLYQYDPLFQSSNSGSPLEPSVPLQQGQHGLPQNLTSSNEKTSIGNSSFSQPIQGPPGYNNTQSQYPYGGQQYQQPGNYFMQHQMGYQPQGYNQQPNLNQPSQPQQQRTQVQQHTQHQTPPQNTYGSWNSSR